MMPIQLVGAQSSPTMKQGGPAFPLVAGNTAFAGMSVRMWLAGMALASGKSPGSSVSSADEILELLLKKPEEYNDKER